MSVAITHFHTDEIHMIQIPRLTAAQRTRASDWPTDIRWTGSMRVTSEGDGKGWIYFESEGKLFAKADLSKPGVVEQAVDSSRYYVVVLTDEKSGKQAPIGIMFPKTDKTKAFDFKVAIQDWRNQSKSAEPTQALGKTLADLGLGGPSDGKIVMNLRSSAIHTSAAPAAASAPLTPPPGMPAPPGRAGAAVAPRAAPAASPKPAASVDPFGAFADFGFGSTSTQPSRAVAPAQDPFGSSAASDPFDNFGDFAAPQTQPSNSSQGFDWNF